MKKGDKVVLPLGGGQMLQGVVSSTSPNDAGRVRVAGRLNGEKGTFSMSQSVGDTQDLAGNIVQNDQHVIEALVVNAPGIELTSDRPTETEQVAAVIGEVARCGEPSLAEVVDVKRRARAGSRRRSRCRTSIR